MQHPLAEQRKASLAIALSVDQFQFGHMAFDHAIVDPPGEAIFHGIFVSLDSSGKRLEWRQVCCLLPGQARHRGALPCECATSGQIAEPGHRPDQPLSEAHEAWPAFPALQYAIFQVDEETGRKLVVKEQELVPSMGSLGEFFALLEAYGPGCHGHSHKNPCSLAPPVLEKGTPYCGCRLPNAQIGRADTDQGGSPAHVACVRETLLQPANSVPYWLLFQPVGQ